MADDEIQFTRVMVVAAHPDDPEFACAGTVAKWAAEGKEILYCLATSGNAGTHDAETTSVDLASTREREQLDAARELGVKDVIFLRHDDGTLINDLALRKEIVLVMRRYQPEVVVTIDPWRHYQLHPDHRAAGQAALDAIYSARERLIFSDQLKDGVDVCRPKMAFLFWTENADYWVDISSTIDKRIAAVMLHHSQVSHRDDIEDRIRQMTHELGQKQGFEYAEGFKRLILG